MRTSVTETSRAAHRSLSVKDYLQPKEAAVMSLFTEYKTMLTRKQISKLLNAEFPDEYDINVVTGRVGSLMSKPTPRLVVRGFFKDPKTHKEQELLGLPPPMPRKQVPLFPELVTA
jgi:hypothetical protein